MASSKQGQCKPAAPYCRPGCAMACATTSWAWVLDDLMPAPPDWRLAWAIHGIPNPVPVDEYRDMFAAFETAYGTEELLAGVRHAVQIPPCHGSGVDVGRLRALLATLDRQPVAA